MICAKYYVVGDAAETLFAKFKLAVFHIRRIKIKTSSKLPDAP